jgi:nickel transport system substrate-binding protein
LETIRVASGSKNATINGGDDGHFVTSAGSMNPFLYSTNRFFITDWIFEGLVGYEDDGEIFPVLASSWVQERTDKGQKVTFTLREGVQFHDGSDWNCSVAKLNFDHVLAEGIRERHTWYGTPRFLSSWTCDDDGRFVLETNQPFYPLLQELTYIRPLVFASANSFAYGFDSHPERHNSCDDPTQPDVTCMGLKAPIGTGPFKYISREPLPGDETIDAKVTFSRNENYWGTVPDIEFLELRYYPDNKAVYDALLSGDLDMAMGIGPLTPLQVQDIKFNHSDQFDVRHSEVTQNSILIMNTAKAPTDDINVRRAIIHALDKAFFVEKEFAGLEQPTSQMMPFSLPFCDVDLTPKWSYDFVKAASLNCPVNSDLSAGGIAGIVVATIAFVTLMSFLFVMIRREKSGKPIFSAEQVDTAEKA